MLEDRNEQALADFTAAVALDPRLAHAFANRGYLLNRLGRFDEAFADLARALELTPEDDDVRYHAALVELLHGRWQEGLPHYDARLTARSLDTTRTFIPPAFPRWQGEPLDGDLLVLFTEQGRGDVIQFARFVTELAKAGTASRSRHSRPTPRYSRASRASSASLSTPTSWRAWARCAGRCW